jgi:prepilin-type N-terminal cleavage/methylation domain-containing protein
MTRLASTTQKKRATKRAGYTLIEVMMAVSIMTVGSVGVLALHQATTRGNVDAREASIATEVTRTWLERVRRDALRWNAPGTSATSGTLLENVPSSSTDAGVWETPTGPISGESYNFDYHGIDTTMSSTTRPPHFCVNIRTRWVVAQEAIRVDVRTWWHRLDENTDRTAFDCDSDPADVTDELDSTTPALRAVYGSTVVRWARLGS